MALASSGSLSLRNAAGSGRDICEEVYGSVYSGDKSLSQASLDAGKSSPHAMTEFYSFNGTPVTPSSVTATDIYPNGIDLSWSASGNADNFEEYRIERDEDGGGYIFLAFTASTSYNDPDSNLTLGNTYTYRVRSETINDARVSSYGTSNSVPYGV
jgi:fibronectin type 3 domain-containing protein